MPVGGSWALGGWLRRLGFTDVAGALWVHVAGGAFAAAGAYFVGPRLGKYHRDGSASVIPGHSVPLAAVGVLLVLVGWVPYVAGCTTLVNPTLGLVDKAALGVLLSAAAGGLSSLAYAQFRYGKPDVLLTLLGVTGALVASTAGAGVVAAPWMVLTGAVAGVLVPAAALWVDLIARLDDPAGGVAVHAAGGAWGVLSAGLFAPGTIAERLKHLGVQALGLLAIAALSAVAGAAVFAFLRNAVGLRAKEADEFDGLDLAQHDVGAYPDFQQNTIRSYHLRES